jgi:hypothetical protein
MDPIFYYGWDGDINLKFKDFETKYDIEGSTDLTKEDKLEIIDFMIESWNDFKKEIEST